MYPNGICTACRPLDIRALWPSRTSRLDDLRDRSLKPVPVLDVHEQSHIFDVLDQRDVFLHHPYDSFDPVTALVEQAADDPTSSRSSRRLYRTSGDSPIVAALTRAADQGKQVTVLVELMARFDEQRNIQWARRLEEVGRTSSTGSAGSRCTPRRAWCEAHAPGLKRYVHLGTGNYNDRTARLYTDMGLMTSAPEVGADVRPSSAPSRVFRPAPHEEARDGADPAARAAAEAHRREARRAEAGEPAEIRAKMNSLVDGKVIRALYEGVAGGGEDPAQRGAASAP